MSKALRALIAWWDRKQEEWTQKERERLRERRHVEQAKYLEEECER